MIQKSPNEIFTTKVEWGVQLKFKMIPLTLFWWETSVKLPIEGKHQSRGQNQLIKVCNLALSTPWFLLVYPLGSGFSNFFKFKWLGVLAQGATFPGTTNYQCLGNVTWSLVQSRRRREERKRGQKNIKLEKEKVWSKAYFAHLMEFLNILVNSQGVCQLAPWHARVPHPTGCEARSSPLSR